MTGPAAHAGELGEALREATAKAAAATPAPTTGSQRRPPRSPTAASCLLEHLAVTAPGI
jgi:hypothetical protein